MGEAFRGLTTRGRSFLAAGLAATLSALVLGEKDLLRVSILLLALPLLAAWHVGRARYKLACQRSLDPYRVQAGGTARVLLRLQNVSRLPTGTLLLEDKLPYALGSRPRLVLDRLGAQQASSVAYTVRAELRGRYEVGPLTLRMTDPFGLCEMTRAFPSSDRLTVIPQVTPLPMVRLAGEYVGTGDSRARSVAVHGEDDAATREYRQGDDLRRVHWRSTARVGELMVRREEQPWESRATVVLDTRSYGHRGEGPTGSFEWAVSAVASISVHLRQSGYKMRLVTDVGADIEANEIGGDGLLLDHLAEVKSTARGDISTLVDQVRRRSDGGLVIAVLGLLTEAEARLLANLRTNGTTCIGFAMDTHSWLNLPAPARAEADKEHAASALALLQNGWRVVPVKHGDQLPTLWPKAARGMQGFALRAAMAETVTIGGGR
ncbi:DUF58 domain-containing protein [Allorhizocola rhizosphaerae]|uniref:DUF58 domain-containing protein n=1 Tax=Allorhizocola rhizosphaerae TaxID=1872709 RepID=UPI000E3BDB52|nr:DUF58 domain-containing protein [Allorhizocola rhizosphaerae]